MSEKSRRRVNPYTQPIVPQIVKPVEEVKKPELENDKTAERQSEEKVPCQASVDQSQVEEKSSKNEPLPVDELEKEKATIEVRLYLTPTLDDKLLDLRQQYKKRTGGKRIKPNEIMRKLIEKATIEDIL